MKKQTKLLSKFAVLLATLGAGATLASAHVAAHADSSNDGWADTTDQTSGYAPGLTDAQKAYADKIGTHNSQKQNEINARAAAKDDAALDKLDAISNKQQAEYDAKMNALAKKNHVKDYGNPDATPAKKTTTKKVAKKTSAKKAVAKKATKKVAKKHVKKATVKKAVKKHARKHARKHAKRLFRIRVKAHKIYAYKTANFHHKHGRKAEKKGTKLYVYGIIKKGHKKFYKVYGGRVITANNSAVSVMPETMVQP